MKNKTPIQDAAMKVAADLNAKDKRYGFDPFTIIAIINCIIGIVRLIYECRKNRVTAKKLMRKPGLVSRFMMKRAVKQHFLPHEVTDVYNSMLNVSKQMSEQELDDILDSFEGEQK